MALHRALVTLVARTSYLIGRLVRWHRYLTYLILDLAHASRVLSAELTAEWQFGGGTRLRSRMDGTRACGYLALFSVTLRCGGHDNF